MRYLIYSFLLLPVFSQAFSSTFEHRLNFIFDQYQNIKQNQTEKIVTTGQFISRGNWEKLFDPLFIDDDDMDGLRQRHLERIESARSLAVDESELKINPLRQIQEVDVPGTEYDIRGFCAKMPKGGMLHVHPNGTLNRETVKEILLAANPSMQVFRKEIDPIAGDDVWVAVGRGQSILKTIDDEGFFLYPSERDFLSLDILNSDTRYKQLPGNIQVQLQELFFLPKKVDQEENPSKRFKRFMSFFMIVGMVSKIDKDFHKSNMFKYRDFFKRAAENGVSYVEFTAPIRLSEKTMDELPRQMRELAELGRSTKVAGEPWPVEARWNLTFYRTDDPVDNQESVKAWIEYLREKDIPEIVGIDFVADESETPALERGQGLYSQAYIANQNFAQQNVSSGRRSFHRTMHAGELGHAKNPRDAMLLGAERLGHGIKLRDDTLALEYAIRNRIGIETNLVSNQRLGVVRDMTKHPFIDFLRLGLPVSFSTDDEGLFETTMNRECEVAISTTDIQYSELKSIAFNGILSSFADDETKFKLVERLEHAFRGFEAEWKEIEALQ